MKWLKDTTVTYKREKMDNGMVCLTISSEKVKQWTHNISVFLYKPNLKRPFLRFMRGYMFLGLPQLGFSVYESGYNIKEVNHGRR